MMLSRYLADRLYIKKESDILPSLYGALAGILVFSVAIGLLFYWRSPLNLLYRGFAYLLFIQLVIEMVLAVYITAVKNYRRIAYSFLYGALLAFAAGYVLITRAVVETNTAVLIAFNICIFIVILSFAYEIKRHFPLSNNWYFAFIKYLSNARLILFTNLFFTTGLYAHNFVFWGYSNLRHTVAQTYIYAPLYDIPAFYAFLSIMPTMVMFVVKLETAFFEKYRSYFALINNGACYEDIEMAKQEMKKTLFKELIYIMQYQLFFSIVFIILGLKFLPLIGFTLAMIDTYNIAVLGFYCVIMMFVIMTVLLYFDNQKGACGVTLFFAVSSALFTWVGLRITGVNNGLGFFTAGLSSLVLALLILLENVRNIDYHVFCVQVAWKQREDGWLERAVDRIGGARHEG